MIQIASSQFGCDFGNVTCYCTNQDFGYGIRDCSNEACSASDAAEVIAFGTQYCESESEHTPTDTACHLTFSSQMRLPMAQPSSPLVL
jgi:hypothetical protein